MIFMINPLLIAMNFYLLTQYPIVQTKRIKTNIEICVENQFPKASINYLKICYLNDKQDQSIVVWFSVGKSLNDTFDLYRFVLRSINDLSSSNIVIETLTNFTKLVDFSNSLRMFHLETGYYEVCIEFQSESPSFIYQPRDGCISIPVGISPNKLFKQSSRALLIALASAIVLFFILGLVVQWAKEKRRKELQENENQLPSPSSRKPSVISLKQQQDDLINKIFQQNIDQTRSSRMQQWAHNRAHRHSIAIEEQDFERPILLRKWGKNSLISTDPSSNMIHTISGKEHQQISPRKNSFHLSLPEQHAF